MFVKKPSEPQQQDATAGEQPPVLQSTGLRLRLWLISCSIGALVWAMVLASLYRFVSDSLPLADDDGVVGLIRDRFLFSFGFTAPLLGALTYFAVLLIAGQQQEVEETRTKVKQLKAKVKLLSETATSNQEDGNQLQKNLMLLLSQQYRTPLTTILSSSELIERYGEDWDKERIDRHLDRIVSSVGMMTGLLNDTLILAGYSETGPLEYEPVTLNLNQFVKDLLDGGTIQFPGQNWSCDLQRIQCEFLSEPLSMQGDPKLLRAILVALLVNALKYSPEDSAVQLKLSYEDGNITFAIKDQGIGIPETELEQVFEPFFRSEIARSLPGNGVGLAIAQACAELHGGTIILDSVESEGTVMTVTLPMSVESGSSTTYSKSPA